MSFLLRVRLWRAARRSSPSSVFLRALEAKLFPPAELITLHRLRALRFAVVPALLVVSCLGGTGVYAYASDQVLPDHALYPLRQSLERFEVQIAAVTPMKDRVHLRLLERRAREKKLLEQKQQKAKALKVVPVKVVPGKDVPAKIIPAKASPTSTKAAPAKKVEKNGQVR
ncbi:hypothetical protein KBD61_04770 [Patescibacteria group bacterium]|nr:hypothetical protein [Patescibacteria group bacterium]MBP9710303.1 hypothetical protein [Patescibacteria group bacterium]